MDELLFWFYILLVGAPIVYFSLKSREVSASDWGSYYKKELRLTRTERKLLNEISSRIRPDSVYKIDFCKERGIDLFLRVYRLSSSRLYGDLPFDLFSYCVCELKKRYRVFTPVSVSQLNEIAKLELVIGNSLKIEVQKACSELQDLTVEQERVLYNADKGRWRFILEDIKSNYSDVARFYEGIKSRESLIYSLVAKRNLYYGAYSFMLDKDKAMALKFYMHYLHVGSDSATFRFKAVTKQHQEDLFTNDIQLKKFQSILDDYNKQKDLDRSFVQIDELYAKKRKKVVLDEHAIKLAKEDLVGVVDLLNEYLEDEGASEETISTAMEKSVAPTSINVELSSIQSEFLAMLVSKSLPPQKSLFVTL